MSRTDHLIGPAKSIQCSGERIFVMKRRALEASISARYFIHTRKVACMIMARTVAWPERSGGRLQEDKQTIEGRSVSSEDTNDAYREVVTNTLKVA